MTEDVAKKIGSNSALKSVTIGLIVAYLIMMLLTIGDGFFKALIWIIYFDNSLNLIVSMGVIYLCSYLFGRFAGNEIIMMNKNAVWVGIKYSFITLVISTFISSFWGLFQAMEKNDGVENLFGDYIMKPVFLVSIVGLIPVIIIGALFGTHIKRRA